MSRATRCFSTLRACCIFRDNWLLYDATLAPLESSRRFAQPVTLGSCVHATILSCMVGGSLRRSSSSAPSSSLLSRHLAESGLSLKNRPAACRLRCSRGARTTVVAAGAAAATEATAKARVCLYRRLRRQRHGLATVNYWRGAHYPRHLRDGSPLAILASPSAKYVGSQPWSLLQA